MAYTNITNTTGKTNAKAVNDTSAADTVTVGKHDTFQLIANGTSTYDNSAADDKNVYDTHLQKRYEVTWKNEDGTVLETSIVDADALPVYNGETPVKVSTDTADYTFSGWSPEVVAANADTTYTAMYGETAKFRFAHTLTLKGNIGVNFYYTIPDTYNGNLAIKFHYRGKDYDGELTPVNISGYNYRATFTVAAKEMTEPITATLTCDEEVIDSHDYTIKQYADYIIAHPSDYGEKMTHLAKAMLNYGGSAQVLFSYNTENLANADLGDYSMIPMDDITPPAFDISIVNEGLSKYSLSYAGSTLLLKTETVLRLYFNKLEGYDGSVSATVNGINCAFKNYDDQFVYLDIANIPAKNIGDTWSISVGDTSFEYSTLNYISSVITGTNTELITTVNALYDYYKAAQTYFNK